MRTPPMETSSAVTRLRVALYWVAVWLAIVVAIVAVGALLGAVCWLVFGVPLGSELNWSDRLAYGASVGWRYARVWAGGIAFVLCFIKAHEGFSVRAWLRARRR